MTFAHLLHLARMIQLHDFDRTLFLKSSHGRIIESQMTVFANTKAAKIDCLGCEEPFVPVAFVQREVAVSIDEMKVFGPDERLNWFPQITAEAGFVIFNYAQGFINGEEHDFGPINLFERDELYEELDLGISRHEEYCGGTYFIHSRPKQRVHPERRIRGEILQLVKALHREVIRLKG